MSRADFTFDKDRNVYVCPNGKLLHTTGRIHDGVTVLYRARTHDCGPCPLKPKCCPKSPERKIPRSIYERDAARALADTEAFEQSRRDRKRVEMLFAHLKRILRLGRLGCAALVARKTSSRSPQSHKTYDGSPNWWPDHHQHQLPRTLCNSCGREYHCVKAGSQWSIRQRAPQKIASAVSLY